MKLLRWRLWSVMGLVLACALGLKAVLVVQARQAAIERRVRLQRDLYSPPTRTPQLEAELVGVLGDPDAGVRLGAARVLAGMDSTAPELVGPLIEVLESETADYLRVHRRTPLPDPGRALQRYQFPFPAIAPRLAPALANPDRSVRGRALAVLFDAAERSGPWSAPESVVAPLLAILGDTGPGNRFEAAKILVHLGPAARGGPSSCCSGSSGGRTGR